MTHATRRTLQARHWLIPGVDRLEERALLSATAVTHPALIPAHVEVSQKSTHAGALDTAAFRDAVSAYSPANHPAKANVKAAHAQVKHPAKVKATPPAPVRNLTDLVRSPLVTKKTQAGGSPIPGAFAPSQIEAAYTVTSLGVANQGQGQTIGIVDEYHDPNILADANAFASHYGLPQFNVGGGPTLTVFKDTALGAVPNSPQGGGDTSIETSLDVEWAHAMAPKANILLVEVPASNFIDTAFAQLLAGVQYAASQPGVSVVSLSYGYPETNAFGGPVTHPNQPFIDLPALYSQNQTFLTPAPVSNIAVTISSGDYSTPLYPATSPNVIAVGGTALFLNSTGQYGSETAWGGKSGDGAAGGGSSAFYSTPTFQSNNGVNFAGKRSIPDVALLADPATGVSVYDSYSSNGGNPWTAVGGTSLASPLFAGILSLAQQDRAALSKAPLTSAQINNAVYALFNSPAYSTYFHDVTLGKNADVDSGVLGHSTATGYDQATGLGSPIARTLVPYLASL